jgi:hypothetical protein
MERESALGRSAMFIPDESELDYNTLQGDVWDYFREQNSDAIGTLWKIKSIMLDIRTGNTDEDALDTFLNNNPDLDDYFSLRILKFGNKSALKLLDDEVEKEINNPDLAVRPTIKQTAA